MSPSPSFDHQNISLNLAKKISDYVEAHDLGTVAIAPLDVHFDDDEIYQPDIFFISNENKFIIQKGAIYGAPDFIVEILSPSNANYDLVEKKKIYEQRGVKEYWVVDPETKEATGFVLRNEKYEVISKAVGEINSLLFNTTFKVR
jgi:Uma2 family endonuclease